MADLESLQYKSISEMTVDEALEHLRQIRLSRRIPDKPKARKKTTTTRQPKKTPVPSINSLDLSQVEALLNKLGGK